MAIKQCMAQCTNRVFLLTVLLLSGVAVLGGDPAGDKLNRVYHLRQSQAADQTKEQRIDKARGALREVKHFLDDLYAQHIERIALSEAKRELIKADLVKNFQALGLKYQRNIEAALPNSEQDFLAVLQKERSMLEWGCESLILRLRRSLVEALKEKQYNEQFPSLNNNASIPRKIKNKQNIGQAVTTKNDLVFLRGRVATVGGLSVATKKQELAKDMLILEQREATQRHHHPYIHYIINNILRDPIDHYFPFVIDDEVLKRDIKTQGNNYDCGRFIMYRQPGTLGGNEGVFEIGIGIDTHQGEIFHRMFRKELKDLSKNLQKMAEAGGTIIH